jgi:hypothetical protein
MHCQARQNTQRVTLSQTRRWRRLNAARMERVEGWENSSLGGYLLTLIALLVHLRFVQAFTLWKVPVTVQSAPSLI